MSTSSSADGGTDGTFRANADQAPSDDNGSEDPGQIDLDALAAAFQVKDWETVNASVLTTWIHDGENGLHFYAQVDDGADPDPNRALARQLIVAGLKMLSPDSCVRQDGDDHLQAKEEPDSEPPPSLTAPSVPDPSTSLPNRLADPCQVGPRASLAAYRPDNLAQHRHRGPSTYPWRGYRTPSQPNLLGSSPHRLSPMPLIPCLTGMATSFGGLGFNHGNEPVTRVLPNARACW